jgi:hypothetical protein
MDLLFAIFYFEVPFQILADNAGYFASWLIPYFVMR